MKVHRDTGGLLATSSDAAAYLSLAQGGPPSGGPGGPRVVGGPRGVGGPSALLLPPAAAEQGIGDTWEEYPDFFAAAEGGPTSEQQQLQGPRGPPADQGPQNGLPAAAVAAAAAAAPSSGAPSPPPRLEAPDSWVQALLLEGRGGPPGGPHEVSSSSSLSSSAAAEAWACLGLPGEEQTPETTGAPEGPPPHRLAFLNCEKYGSSSSSSSSKNSSSSKFSSS